MGRRGKVPHLFPAPAHSNCLLRLQIHPSTYGILFSCLSPHYPSPPRHSSSAAHFLSEHWLFTLPTPSEFPMTVQRMGMDFSWTCWVWTSISLCVCVYGLRAGIPGQDPPHFTESITHNDTYSTKLSYGIIRLLWTRSKLPYIEGNLKI